MIWKIFTDGGARGNPGPAAAAFVVWDDAGKIREKRGKYLGKATNNEAEYRAVIEALGWISEHKQGLAEIKFFLDSSLVVNQLNGLFRVKEARLLALKVRVQEQEGKIAPLVISYSHVPREENFEADKLVNETLDKMLQF